MRRALWDSAAGREAGWRRPRFACTDQSQQGPVLEGLRDSGAGGMGIWELEEGGVLDAWWQKGEPCLRGAWEAEIGGGARGCAAREVVNTAATAPLVSPGCV